MNQKKVVILGGGVAGLSAAWILRKNGYSVKILEKSQELGGLAITRSDSGYRFDLGPHNIHTSRPYIIRFFQQHTDGFFEHFPFNQVFKNGRFIQYPLRGLQVVKALRKHKVVPAIVSFVIARFRLFLTPVIQEKSFEEWVQHRFGTLLYEEYFGKYAEKVWGTHPSEIDKYVAEKRVPATGLTDMIRAIFAKPIAVEHPEFAHKNYYFRQGVAAVVDFFVQDLRRLNTEIVTSVELTHANCTSGKLHSVSYKINDQEHLEECDYLLSTIPINTFVGYFDSAPENLKTLAREVDYCSTVLLFLKVNKPKMFSSPLVYFSDPKIRFSRVSDVGMYSKDMVPSGKTLLCVEFPCNLNDPTWAEKPEALYQYVIDVFSAKGFLRPSDCEGFFYEPIANSYPRFKVGFKERVNAIFRFLSGYPNVLSYGRQGGFAYLNVDDVIHQGFSAASAVMMAETVGEPCQRWFAVNNESPYNF